jgi:hypothetical protein
VVIPPNTTAQIYVPTTNANAITESGVPASNSPGVAYLGMSNGCAIYAVGSGQYVWSSPLAVPPPAAVAETDSVYAGGNFPALPPGDLITNATTTVVANTITVGPENQLPNSALYDGNIGEPLTTNRSYEISGGEITFYLGPEANGAGYTITNLNTYTAWRDDGREDANYTVSYSPDGATYSLIATVDYNPSPYPTKDGTGGTLTSVAVTNLTGVRYLKWDFTAAQQNGGVGYTELAAFGQASVSSAPTMLSVTGLTLTSFVMNVNGLASGQSYMLQSSTNLAAAVWSTETNFVAMQAVVALTNSTGNDSQKFYRIVGY